MTKLRHLIWTVVAAAGLMISASHSFAQQPDVGDQPGLLPDDSVQLDPEFRKQMVYYRTTRAARHHHHPTAERHLYLVQGNGRALRYGIGVGRDGFQWHGLLKITRKAEWPDWTPPPEMIARQPYLPRFMAGGPGNPLGARAMYLGTTVYRIHGTNQPDTIGTASLVRLLPAGQCRRDRPLRPRPGRHQGDRAAEAASFSRSAAFHNRPNFPSFIGERQTMRTFRSGLLIGLAIAARDRGSRRHL